MYFTCPCLNVHLNVEKNDQYIDKVYFNELNEENLFDINRLKQYNTSSNNSVKYEHKELIGYIKRDLYTIFKCTCCNIFTHIQLSKPNQNILLINDGLLINEKSEIEKLRTNENYSNTFKIILNLTSLSSLVYLIKDLRPLANYSQLKEFNGYIDHQLTSAIQINEEEKLKSLNNVVVKLINKINLNDNTSQESLESGFIEDTNSNSSINSQQQQQSANQQQNEKSSGDNNLLSFRFRTWSDTSSIRKENKKPNEAAFTFEDAFDEDQTGDINHFTDDIDLDVNDDESDIIRHSEPVTLTNRFQIKQNDPSDSSNLLKYSCSVPRNIPMFSRIHKEPSSSVFDKQQFSYVDDYSLDRNFATSSSNNNNSNTNDDNEENNSNSADLGKAFAELASSIVQKDGKELFGERPSRRIPINSISKSCYDN